VFHRTRKTLTYRAAAAIVATLLLAGCAEFASIEDGGGSRYLAAYRPFSSCDDLAAWTRDAMREQVTAWGLNGGWALARIGAVREGSAPVSTDSSASSSAGGSASTTTNVQEAGIDEGDLAENDGRYVYLAVGERLRVIDTTTGELTHTETIPAGEHHMILAAPSPGNGNLVLVTNLWNGSGPETQVRHYRVESGTLSATGTDHLEGSLLAVRAHAGSVHVVVRHDTAWRLAFVAPMTSGAAAEEEALAANRQVVENLNADDILPRMFRVEDDGTRSEPRRALACERIGTPEEYSGLGMTWVASLDIDAADSAVQASAGVLADTEHVYAGSDALYVATVRYPQVGTTTPIRPEPVSTNIHRFDLAPGDAEYRASGSVPGRIISSYSLSHHESLLRVATTTDDAGFGSESMSGIRVLETRGSDLVQVGEVDGLGRGEQIQGVRFAGDMAFVVTFRQIDPLYTIDLTDPSMPRVRGELKIPGFSTWLLPLGDGRLLAFGRSGTDEGSTTGVQWSLFDVADMENPGLVTTLGTGENSEAIWDPKAIAYEPVTGTLLVPGETWNINALPALTPESIGGAGDTADTVPPASSRLSDPSLDFNATRPDTLALPGEWYVSVGRLDGTNLLDIGRVQLPAPGRRAMLVGGRIVSVNSDGSVTIADGVTLEVLLSVS
jgi:uncharacterized secreted protein with C-terminal beta-propeller domain